MVKVKFSKVKVGPDNTHFLPDHEEVSGKIYITKEAIDVDEFVVDIPLKEVE